jgi:hypothetical protein
MKLLLLVTITLLLQNCKTLQHKKEDFKLESFCEVVPDGIFAKEKYGDSILISLSVYALSDGRINKYGNGKKNATPRELEIFINDQLYILDETDRVQLLVPNKKIVLKVIDNAKFHQSFFQKTFKLNSNVIYQIHVYLLYKHDYVF